MVGKLRTRQQRQGESAEQAFAHFASDQGLVPGKPPDYGLDYLCQVEGAPDANGTAQILGDVLAAVVRSSEAKRAKLRLKRQDVERILQSKVPVLLVMPHRPPGARHWTIRSKAVDQRTFVRLAEFLERDTKQMHFTPSELAPENNFQQEVRACLPPRLMDRLSASWAERRLAGVLRSPAVSVITRSAGTYSFVATDDYLSQFDIETENDWLELHRRAVRSPSEVEAVASAFGIKGAVIEALRSLPQPVVVGGPCPVPEAGPRTLYVFGKLGRAHCETTATRFAKHTSYTHESGLSITISEAMPQGDEHVHVMHTSLDGPLHLDQHPDLTSFLAKCIPPAEWSFRDERGGIPVEATGDLVLFGLYAYELERLDDVLMDAPIWSVSQAPPVGDSLMLALVSNVKKVGVPLGFQIGEPTSEEPGRFVLPVVGNVGDRTLVASLTCEGTVFYRGDRPSGLRARSVQDVTLDWRDGRTRKTEDPELVLQPGGGPSIAFSPDGRQRLIEGGIAELDDVGIELL